MSGKKVITDPTGIIKPLKTYVRKMKKNPTPSEAELWKVLQRDFKSLISKKKIKRQVIFGWYILDFVVLDKNLVIELDGNSHIGREEYDRTRDAFIASYGVAVLRFRNEDVWKCPRKILEAIRRRPSCSGFKSAQYRANLQRIRVQEKQLNKVGLKIDRLRRQIVSVEPRTVQIKRGRVLTGLASKFRPRCPGCNTAVAGTWKTCQGCNATIEWVE